ncbi:MAG: LytR C-terminal domain-containing protein [Candidatus Moraniibacteriota bacterium]|nr:MAG: LytR C-terminal domain-containing protein [Candidatus Moranbacteria bacterium]
MIQSFFTIISLIFLIVIVGYGSSWFIDNRKEIFKENGVSIDQIAKEKLDNSLLMKEMNDKLATETEKEEAKEEEKEGEASEELVTKKIDIAVLNGGGAKGVAGKLAESLKKNGFEKIVASNASSYAYKGVTVYYKEEKTVADEVSRTIKSLGGYGEVTVQKGAKGDEISHAIVVIIGE